MSTTVHKIEIYVTDHQSTHSIAEIKDLIEDHPYLFLSCGRVESKDAGEWDDNHPMNQRSTNKKTYFDSLPSSE